jgi:hypothetical protein
MVNRYEPLVTHLAAGHVLHPEDLYRLLLEMAGELCSFNTTTKRPAQFATYRHDDLKATFEPVIKSLRDSLSMVLQTSAVPIPLVEKRYGIRVGRVPDLSLLDSARFVLAVSAQMPAEELWAKLPRQIKIGSVEVITQLVNTQLPGIQIRPLPVAPRQVPFMRATSISSWIVRASSGRASSSRRLRDHVGGTIPGLTLEFWAIRVDHVTTDGPMGGGDRTVLKPTPGGSRPRPPGSGAPPPPPPPPSRNVAPEPSPAVNAGLLSSRVLNPLVAAAGSLFAVASLLRVTRVAISRVREPRGTGDQDLSRPRRVEGNARHGRSRALRALHAAR